jgi:hypothetical protein
MFQLGTEQEWKLAQHNMETATSIHFFPSDYGKLYWSDGVAESMNWWDSWIVRCLFLSPWPEGEKLATFSILGVRIQGQGDANLRPYQLF